MIRTRRPDPAGDSHPLHSSPTLPSSTLPDVLLNPYSNNQPPIRTTSTSSSKPRRGLGLGLGLGIGLGLNQRTTPPTSPTAAADKMHTHHRSNSFSLRRRLYHPPRTIILVTLAVLAVAGWRVAVLIGSKPPTTEHRGYIPSNFIDEIDHDYASHTGVLGWLKQTSQTNTRPTVLVTGGAGQIGQVLVARLAEDYTVHVLDILPRPSRLSKNAHIFYHRGSVSSSSSGVLKSLFSSTSFDGVIHLAAVSLEEWCDGNYDECLAVNAGGTDAVLERVHAAGKSRSTRPWVVLASSMDVYGAAELGGKITEDSTRRPDTAIGKTKLVAEQAVQASPSTSAIILRFAEVYGHPYNSAIPSSFMQSLLTSALTALPIQYSSDTPPLDLIHVGDAVDAIVSSIHRLEDGVVDKTESFNIVNGGGRWLAKDIVEIVRAETKSLSPVRDIGTGRKPYEAYGVAEYSATRAAEELGWQPTTLIQVGLGWSILEMYEAMGQYSRDYIAQNCGPSPEFPSAHAPKLPQDERNRNLAKLDGCTVNLGFNHQGWIHHVKCQDGKHCSADADKVVSYNWNASTFVISKAGLSSGRRVTIRLAEENGQGYLGIPKGELNGGGQVNFQLTHSSPDIQTSFEVEVAPDNSYLRLMVDGDQVRAISNVTDASTWFSLESMSSRSPPVWDMRMNVLCCPSEGDWPLLLDDAESADVRFGTTGQIPFNSSRRLHTCERAREAARYSNERLAASRKTVDAAAARAGSGGDPFSADVDTRAALPTSPKPHDWVSAKLPPCWNDCNSPAVCVQTGSCRCVHAECPDRRPNPLLALRPPSSSYDHGKSALGIHRGFDPVLVNTVEQIDWHDILLPEAREYLRVNPDFVKVHVVSGYEGEEAIEAAECHKLQQAHCFSADNIMYRAIRHLSVPPEEAELVVLPVYQHCTGAEFRLHDVMAHAHATVPDLASKHTALMLTHDWGICEAFEWEIWSAREHLYPDYILDNVIVWSVMGDFDSPCYRPHQDIVVPARTCRSDSLEDAFGDINKIRPMKERPHLITWAGTYWGTGKSDRLRLACGRGGAGKRELLFGKGPQSSFLSWDYMNDLSNARFCPQPRGIAGWSPRTNDAIYAGCIPVFIAEGTHYPFASFLDWTQLSIRIDPTELDQIERILASIPLERIEQIQANLVAIREAFLYSSDEEPEKELKRRGPMFFALHEAAMRMRTVYPVAQEGA